MLRFKEKAFIKIIDECKYDDGEIPFHCSQLRMVPRPEKTNHGITQGESEDQHYDGQPHRTHLEHDVKKAVLRLCQNPRDRQNYAIRFAFEASQNAW